MANYRYTIVRRTPNGLVRHSIRVIGNANTGPVGPQGPPGASGAGYVHTQASAATTWTIAHNLGFYPDVSAFNTGNVEIAGQVIHLSTNVTQITFNSPQAGTARLV